MKTKFRVGDEVWDDVHFPDIQGEVSEIHNNMVRAVFSSGSKFNGFRWYKIDNPCPLSLVPYKFELPPQPERCEFEKYERVLVRDTRDEEWRPRIFKQMSGGNYYAVYEGSIWLYCRKWDESLIGKVTES